MKLVFDSSNNFIMSCTRIDYTSTPQVVQDTVSATYAGYTVKSKCEQMNLATGSINYQLFMKSSSVRKRVIVSDAGAILCEQ
jgi:hypothetical protein